jgi:uncharacterized protein
MNDHTRVVGYIEALRRYPVKSMQGEAVEHSPVTVRGLLGDRAYAVVDRATGMVASAKNPRKWQQLWACHTAYVEPPQLGASLPPVRITLPDGTTTRSDDPDIDGRLSSLTGRDVRLTTLAPPEPQRETLGVDATLPEAVASVRVDPLALAAPGTFFDFAPVHVLATATLDHLRSLAPSAQWDVRRFRPNIVVAADPPAAGFVENTWLGRTLVLASGVRLHMSDPTPRCVVTTLAQDDLAADPVILRTAAQHNAVASVTFAPGYVFAAVVGAYAHVCEEGILSVGAPVTLH